MNRSPCMQHLTQEVLSTCRNLLTSARYHGHRLGSSFVADSGCAIINTRKYGFFSLRAKFPDRRDGGKKTQTPLDFPKKEPLHLPKPYELPHLRERTSSRIAMGLKKLDEDNWLTIDSKYLPEHKIRHALLDNSLPSVVQCLPGSETACLEILELVTAFLAWRYPEHFTISLAPPTIHNHLTGETHSIGPDCANPMEIAARLAMEDFNVLVKDPGSGKYVLQASATLFPAGWELRERIGTSMKYLHAPVPNWEETIGSHVYRYFDKLSPKTNMERYNLFVQTTTDLFQTTLNFQQTPTVSLTSVSVRRERQTFRRLPRSGAVLFTVRTFLQPLLELDVEDIRGLASQIRGWDEAMGAYKGIEGWGELVLGWCDERLAESRA